MNTTGDGITGVQTSEMNKAKKLLLAMSPADLVLSTFHLSRSQKGTDNAPFDLQEQDEFAVMIQSCWTEFGPSKRYVKRLVTKFVRLLEQNDSVVESDSLANLVAEASCIHLDEAPDSLESCYVSFYLGKEDSDLNCIPLRIRIFPYHNDVALRLWEAGNCLAEFFIDHPDIIAGKALIELGSGCGATGLAIAACCQPSNVHLTDYTEACRLNMEHNLQVNQEWLSQYDFPPDRISQGSLEWESFLKEHAITNFPHRDLSDDGKDTVLLDDSIEAFRQSDILFAADVIYDMEVIDHLVHVVKCFLIESPISKQAIFASTKRNMATFEFFLKTIEKYDMECTWLMKDEECDNLTKIFEGDFIQSRRDVRICRIHLSDFDER